MNKKNAFVFLTCCISIALTSCQKKSKNKNEPVNNTQENSSGDNHSSEEQYIPKYYTIRWVNEDGTELEVDQNALEGSNPSYDGEAPTKENNSEFTYTFIGWSPSISPVSQDTTYTAQYSSEVNSYTITWQNWDGSVLEVDTDVPYGTTPTYDGETPTKDGDAQYCYVFTGWSPDVNEVIGDNTYVAQFSASINSYTVTWQNWDGSVLEIDTNVPYGTTPTYDSQIPTRSQNSQYSYEFTGWSPTISEVSKNTTYTAQFCNSLRSYTITWKNYNGDVLENDNNVPYGSIPTYDGAAPTRSNSNLYTYTWSGWSPQVDIVYGDKVYTATFSSERIKYSVDFDLNGGSSSSYSGPKQIIELSKSIFFFDCVKDGWTFRGWSYNGIKIFDEKGNQLSNVTLTNGMTFVAEYSQTTILTVTVNMPEAGSIVGEGEYPYNTYVDVTAQVNQGYAFVGWYYQNTLLSQNTDYKYMMWNEDVVLEARFKLAAFSLNIYSNNSNYGLVLLKEYNNYQASYQKNYNYKSTVTIAAYSQTSVRFLGWYDLDNQLVSTKAVYTFTMPNYDYTLEAKWDYFTITYNLFGGTNNESNLSSYTKDMSIISLYEPSKSGYEFVGWEYNGNYITEIDPLWIRNITLNAVWRATSYSITYELYGGTNSSLNPSNYTVESDTINLVDPLRTGYTFEGWYTSNSFTNRVTNIPSGTIGDKILYAKWTAIVYSISYELNGGTTDFDNPTSYTVEDQINLNSAYKPGYTGEWYDQNNNLISTIHPGTTGNLSLENRWKANLNNLLVISEDISKGTVAITCGSGYSDEQITVVATPVGDWVFKGWYHEEIKVSNDTTYTFTMPTNDYSLVAHFFTKAEEEVYAKKYATRPFLSDDGKTITYGLYPQTNVNNSSLVSALNALTTPESNGWYLYNNEYYAKVNASPYDTSYTFNNGTKIVSGTTYWFKCEPIIWNVLSNNNGEYYLVSSVLLDAHRYNEYYSGTKDGHYANNYEYSEIRAWLNNDFYNSAFAFGNSNIQLTNVDNSAATTASSSNPYACDNTQDKVFLPSYRDYLNSDYGFSTSTSSTNTRSCRTTDWSRARGASYDSSNRNGNYWTRSPSGGYAWIVANNGNFISDSVDKIFRSVRPGLSIKIA